MDPELVTGAYGSIEVEDRDTHAVIRLARPHKRNAMGPALHEEMCRALDELAARGTVKALVLTGAGGDFCAGMDLEEMFLDPYGDPDEFHRRNATALRWFTRLQAFPAVTVASVNGMAFGGGVALVGFCDIAIAADDATFGLSEINFGIFPGGGTSWAAVHNMGRKQARYHVLTGERFGAAAAAAYGLVTRVVAREELEASVGRLVEVLERKNGQALRAAKEVLDRVESLALPDAIDWETAKLHELSYRSSEAWIRQALPQFAERSYRPGHAPYRAEDGVRP